jgi:hypothetical protein
MYLVVADYSYLTTPVVLFLNTLMSNNFRPIDQSPGRSLGSSIFFFPARPSARQKKSSLGGQILRSGAGILRCGGGRLVDPSRTIRYWVPQPATMALWKPAYRVQRLGASPARQTIHISLQHYYAGSYQIDSLCTLRLPRVICVPWQGRITHQ